MRKNLLKLLIVAMLAVILTTALVACNGGGEQQTQPHEHTFAEEWSHDNEFHWHAATCGHNDQMKDKAEHELVWKITTPASCEDDGVQTGTCVCGYSETKPVDANGHDYTPSWNWESDHSGATLVLTCENNSTHKLQTSAQIFQRNEEDGCGAYIVYTATATLLGETYMDTQRVDNGASHIYRLSKWEWADDYSSAVAVFICQKDNSHIYKSNPVASQKIEEQQPSCTVQGRIKYSVSLEFEYKTYNDEQTQILPTSHTFEKWVNTQEPTCIEEGRKRQQCSVCGKLYGDEEKVDSLGHDFNTVWSFDSDVHWHKCSRCNATDDRIAHTLNNEGECSVCDYATETPASEFTFQARNNNTWSITAYNGTRSNVVIPSQYRGLDVTELGLRAFYNCTSITHLVIPDTITTFQSDVFIGCNNIEEVSAPIKGFASIPKDKIKKITITSGASIEAEQFKDYTLLESITIADSILTIGRDAFAGTAWLKKQNAEAYIGNIFYAYVGTMPENYTLKVKDATVYVVENACKGQTNLTTVILPDSLYLVSSNAFADCTNITNVTMPASAISAIPKDKLNTVTITSGEIPDYAFSASNPIETITIAEDVSKIGYDVFDGCDSLNTVNWDAINCKWDTSYKFKNVSFTTVNIGDNVQKMPKDIFSKCTNITNATMPALAICDVPKDKLKTLTITSGDIYESAYENTTTLETLTIGEKVTEIGESAFKGCTALRIVNWNAIDCIVGREAEIFSSCSQIETVNIGDKVQSIPEDAFSYRIGLKEIIIPNSMQSIGERAFFGCTGLQTVTIGEDVQSIGSYAFRGCTGLQTVNWNATNCTKGGFSGCTSLATVNIGENVQSIPASAFEGCKGLSKITIPKSVTHIGNDAFSRCTGLQTITIGEGITSIGDNAFYDCTNLKEITIPDSVTSIGISAFRYCTGLNEITIPEGITSIGSSAFEDCTGLQTVNWNVIDCIGEPENSSYSLFEGCTQLTILNIGENVRSIPDGVFNGCNTFQTLNWYAINCITACSRENPWPQWDQTYFLKDCKQLSTVNIGENVQIIPPYTFYDLDTVQEIVIPNNVTSIGDGAFAFCGSLQTVTIGDGIKSIGSYAFYDCNSLQSLDLGKCLQSIGDYTFDSCSALKEIIIPNTVTNIGEHPFDAAFLNNLPDGIIYLGNVLYGYKGDAPADTDIIIRQGTTQIYNEAFEGCDWLTSVTIPSSVTKMGYRAFYGCDSLKTINIGKGLKNLIPEFGYCPNLTEIVIPESLLYIDEDVPGDRYSNAVFHYTTFYSNLPDGIIYLGNVLYGYKGDAPTNTDIIIRQGTTQIYNEAFEGCDWLTSIVLPDSLTRIGKNAFYGCTGLSEITIPDSVTNIGSQAFCTCTGLKTVTIGEGVTSIESTAFNYCTGLQTVNWNAVNCENSDRVFMERAPLTEVNIGEKVQTIPAYAFYGCKGLQSIRIPNSVTSIGSSAFADCTGLQTVTIGEGVTSIDAAFYGCTGLSEITIPDSVTSIGSSAFEYCSGLQAVTIGSGVTSIGSSAFAGCTGLTSITIPNSVTSIGSSAFSGCTGFTSITIPNSVISIGSYAFHDCTGLSEITIPDSVTNIDHFAFQDCTGLQTVTIGEGVQSIGSAAFSGCTGITTATMPALAIYSIPQSSLTTVTITSGEFVAYNDDWNYADCTSLQIVTIGESVTSINNGAFKDCTGLQTVNWNAKNCIIGESGFSPLFEGCTELATVNIGEKVQTITSAAFYGCTGLSEITIPDSVTSIGSSAFADCTGLQTVTIGEGVTSIEYAAFSGCTGLTSITIPNSVISIDSYAFKDCTSLQTVNWNATNCTTAGSYSSPIFEGCTQLATVNIGENVQTIPAYAFYGCKGLQSIRIPANVAKIGAHAFEQCTQLTSVQFEDSQEWYRTSSKFYVLGYTFSESVLSNETTAAQYLRSSYASYYWYRKS